MKVSHIIILILIAIGIGAIVASYGNASSFVNFDEAAENPDKEFHVKTQLVKEKEVIYKPEIDPESFTFYAKDLNGEMRKVICLKEKPFDFERSEEVVVIGKVESNGTFVASQIQTKCPSKYENEVEDI
jgi:cytochrome c-type biogenesis protein CcmE